MRNLINSVNSFNGIVYHCSESKFSEFTIDERRGIYFANEPDTDYGKYIYKCRVKLVNPYYSSSLDSFIEIDRKVLIGLGYDGRIVDYKDESDYEMYDIIAFFENQIELISVTE